jgi:HAD superfamily hydrolase (TIGR01509 family)
MAGNGLSLSALPKGLVMAFLKAVIFGAIGTLTETSELQRQAFNQAFADAGHDIIWDAETYRDMVSGGQAVVGGGPRIRIDAAARGIELDEKAVADLHTDKSQNFQNIMTRDGLPVNRGVEALIADAKRSGLSIALASTTSRANIDAMFAAMRPEIQHQFDLILSGEDVDAIKPSPAIYLAALEKLGLNSSEVIAIEDSAPSMAAALAAGIATFVVPGKLWVGSSFNGASAVLPDLEGVTVEQLGVLMDSEPIAA